MDANLDQKKNDGDNIENKALQYLYTRAGVTKTKVALYLP